MKSILLKVDDKLNDELDLIKRTEGLGSKTSTVAFLIKYYLVTKEHDLSSSIAMLEKVLSKIDPESIPPIQEQLKKLQEQDEDSNN